MSIVLNAADLEGELQFIASAGRALLTPPASDRLIAFAHLSRQLRHNAGGIWEIAEDDPIETNWSRGFQRDERGTEPVMARLPRPGRYNRVPIAAL